MTRLTVALVVNPLAGVGGEAALKGSDAEDIQAAARAGKLKLRAPLRVEQFLEALVADREAISWLTVAGDMGERWLKQAGFGAEIVDCVIPEQTHAEDTRRAVRALCARAPDLLVFVGGDGTARDVCAEVGCQSSAPQLALGVPAGVKMHSGVYGIHPTASADLVLAMARGELTAATEQEVRDIDEEAFRTGVVRSRYYGSMRVPEAAEFVQHVKQGGVEIDDLVLLDIAEDIRERMAELEDEGDTPLYIFAPGSTTHFIQQELQRPATLLGVDVFCGPDLISQDASADDIAAALDGHRGPVRLILTAIGGQGHLIGRGNQQLRADILRRVGREGLWPVATKSKLLALEGRPLLLDSGDSKLNRAWSGLLPVITGYRDTTLYRLEGA